MTELKPYPEYKDSGVEWIGEIPEGWNVIRLKHLTNYSLMYGANESAVSNDPKLPRYIRITDIDEYGNLKPDTFKSLEYDKAKSYLLEEGDILFARSGATVGKSYLHKGEVNACYAGYLIRFKSDTSKVLPEYIYYYTQSRLYKQWIQLNTIQATIENVSAEKYSNLFIPLPNKKHQRKITSYLDNEIKMIDKLMSFKSTLIKLLEEKRQAVITETVTKGLDPNVKMKDSGIKWIGKIPEHWDTVKLKHVAISRNIKADRGLPYLGLENVKAKTGEIISFDTSSSIEGESLRFSKNDVLFGKLRPYLRKCIVAPQEGRCTPEFLVLNAKLDTLYPVYLKNIMLSNDYVENINSSTYGAKMPRTSWAFVGDTKIPLPSYLEQLKISKKIDEVVNNINSVQQNIQSQIQMLKEYRESLIYEAVTGKIDLRDYECDEEISEV